MEKSFRLRVAAYTGKNNKMASGQHFYFGRLIKNYLFCDPINKEIVYFSILSSCPVGVVQNSVISKQTL